MARPRLGTLRSRASVVVRSSQSTSGLHAWQMCQRQGQATIRSTGRHRCLLRCCMPVISMRSITTTLDSCLICSTATRFLALTILLAAPASHILRPGRNCRLDRRTWRRMLLYAGARQADHQRHRQSYGHAAVLAG